MAEPDGFVIDKGTLEEQQLTCSVCLEVYKEPKTLPCHHYFCRSCLEKVTPKIEDKKMFLACPTCRSLAELPEPNGVAGLPGTFHINSLLTMMSSMASAKSDTTPSKCAHCPSDNSTTWCNECKMRYCENCTSLHTDCETRSSNTTWSPPQQKCCPTHNKPLEFFCEQRKEIICGTCATRPTHKSHKHIPINEAYKKSRKSLESRLKPLRNQLTTVAGSLKQLSCRENEIVENSEAAKRKIQEMADELIEVIHQSKSELTKEVDSVMSVKLNVLNEQKVSIEETLSEMKNLKDSITQSLQRGDQYEIVQSAEKRLQQIKDVVSNAEKEELTPLEMGEISFIPDQNKDKGLNHIGSISCTLACNDNDPSSHIIVEMVDSYLFVDQCPEVTVVLSIYYAKFPHISIQPSSVRCIATPPGSSDYIKVGVSNSANEPGKFEAKFSPTVNGTYQLNVEVQSRHIDCITVTVPFNPIYYDSITPTHTIKMRKPMGITVTEDKTIVVVSDASPQMCTFDQSGNVLSTLTKPNKGGNNFSYCHDVVVTKDNFLLVADQSRLLKLTLSGDFVASFGSHGSGPLEFNTIFAVVISHMTGFIYVAEISNHRIQVLHPNMTHAFFIGCKGKGIGQFDQPNGLAIDSQGLLYVADTFNNRIQKFTQDGKFLMEFGACGYHPGQLYYPERLLIKDDYLYISEHKNHRLSVFTTDGRFVRCFGKEENEGGFNWPRGIAFDNEGHLYVCDYHNYCIYVY